MVAVLSRSVPGACAARRVKRKDTEKNGAARLTSGTMLNRRVGDTEEGMAEVLLFHHAHGLTRGVLDFAAQLRRAGHGVHTPELYDGRTFTTLQNGLEHARALGLEAILGRGRAAAEALPAGIVYVGFSLGVMPAQWLAQKRSGASGAVFVSACVPAAEFGAWPAHLPVQVHAMEADDIFTHEGDLDAARALVSAASSGHLFLYPGTAHLFADDSLPSFDAHATALLLERVLALLDQLRE
jgi:dienelactone hydrolase